MKKSPSPNTIIDLLVQRLGSAGEGVGYIEGFTVFVEGALPGEKVKVQITEAKRTYAKGKLLSVIAPSPDRVVPPCPVFGRCGGCQIMHLSYEKQLEIKQQRVLDALTRIGHLKSVNVEPCLPSPHPFGYRNKIQLPVSGKPGEIHIGLYARKSHDVIDIERCFIHCRLGEVVFQHMKQLLQASSIAPYCQETHQGELRHVLIRTAVQQNKVLVIFVTNGPASTELIQIGKALMQQCPEVKGVIGNSNQRQDNVILGNKYVTLAGEPSIKETLSGLTFKVSPASFFQVNTFQAENLYQIAIAFADLKKDQKALDAYCGVGTLTLQIAQHVKEVKGIECIPQAIEDANENAKQNGIHNANFICSTVEAAITTIKDIDVVFLNPPRKGCEESVLKAIGEIRPKTLIYISCDPATLARDISRLQPYGYHLEKAQPLDMFPQTSHVETIAKLSLTLQHS